MIENDPKMAKNVRKMLPNSSASSRPSRFSSSTASTSSPAKSAVTGTTRSLRPDDSGDDSIATRMCAASVESAAFDRKRSVT